jgi:hypothetical protein
LIGRIGYWLYSAHGVPRRGGGEWREDDFIPRNPPSPKALALIAMIEGMKLEAAQKKKAQNGES